MLNAPTSVLQGCQKKKKREKGPEKISEEIIAENFPSMGRNHSLKSKKHNEYHIK